MRTLGVTLITTTMLVACTPPDDDPPARDAGLTPQGDAGPGELTDPLSMPATPTLRVSDFTPAQQCRFCHQDQYALWRTSMHAYAMVDPVFQALVGVRQADFQGRQDRFCLQCHSAAATRGGEIVPGFSFNGLSSMAMEGISCDSCHRAADVVRPYNSGHRLDPGGPIRGPLTDPIRSPSHDTQPSGLFRSPVFCAGCHDVVEANGMPLERPYAEWLESPAAGSGKTCQACHMPPYTGRAAAGGPLRDGLGSHRFVGVDVPLKPGFLTAEEEARIASDADALLASAASPTLDVPATTTRPHQLDVHVTIQNLIDGHFLPTGTTFMRQVWLELDVVDGRGNVLYATGTLDANGDLRDHWSSLDQYGDHDLITLGSGMLNARGEPELFPWRAVEHQSNAIPPLYKRTYTLFVPTAAAVDGPLTVEARLRFRSHAPFLLRALGLGHLVERTVIRDMARARATVALEP